MHLAIAVPLPMAKKMPKAMLGRRKIVGKTKMPQASCVVAHIFRQNRIKMQAVFKNSFNLL